MMTLTITYTDKIKGEPITQRHECNNIGSIAGMLSQYAQEQEEEDNIIVTEFYGRFSR